MFNQENFVKDLRKVTANEFFTVAKVSPPLPKSKWTLLNPLHDQISQAIVACEQDHISNFQIMLLELLSQMSKTYEEEILNTDYSLKNWSKNEPELTAEEIKLLKLCEEDKKRLQHSRCEGIEDLTEDEKKLLQLLEQDNETRLIPTMR